MSRTLGAREISNGSRAAEIELFYLTDVFSGYDETYVSHVEPFIRRLEEFLKVKRKKLDVDGIFKQQAVAGGRSLKDYLDTVSNFASSSRVLPNAHSRLLLTFSCMTATRAAGNCSTTTNTPSTKGHSPTLISSTNCILLKLRENVCRLIVC